MTRPTPADSLPQVTRRQLITLLGVSLRGFAELEAAGVITAARPGRGGRPSLYALGPAVRGYIAHVERVRLPNGEREARTRRDLASAKLQEQLHARRSGEVLERADVEHAWSLIIRAIRARLLAMPDALADRCAHATTAAEAQQLIHDAVDNALRELAAWQPPAEVPPVPTPTPKRRTA